MAQKYTFFDMEHHSEFFFKIISKNDSLRFYMIDFQYYKILFFSAVKYYFKFFGKK